MKKLLISLLMLAYLASCKTPQQLIDSAMNKDSVAVAKYTRDKFPCVPQKIKVADSAEYKKWQKSALDIATYYDSLLLALDTMPRVSHVEDKDYFTCDTLILRRMLNTEIERTKILTKKVNSLLSRPAPPALHDTILVEDNAKLFIAGKELEESKFENKELKAQIETLEGKLERRTKKMWIFFFVACAEALWILRKPILKLVKLIV